MVGLRQYLDAMFSGPGIRVLLIVMEVVSRCVFVVDRLTQVGIWWRSEETGKNTCGRLLSVNILDSFLGMFIPANWPTPKGWTHRRAANS